MVFGVMVDGFAPAGAIGAQAAAAEAGGARILWIATHLYYRDPVVLATAALAATRTIEVGLMAISPYAMHPVHAAMAAATLDELHPGRVVLSLGVGAPAMLAAAGIAPVAPLVTLTEAVEVCRRLLGGAVVDYRGEVFRLSDHGLASGARSVPVVLAASGPRMLGLAGRIADGVILSGAASAPFVRWSLDQVARGAGGRRVERHGIVYAHLAPTPPGELRRSLGFILQGRHHARNIELAGVGLDQAALRRAFASEDWGTLEALITDEVVAAHTACGPPDAVRARIDEYRRAGLDLVVLGGLSSPEQIRDTLDALR